MNNRIIANNLLIKNSTLSEESKQFLLSYEINTLEKLNEYKLSELKFLKCPIKIILEIGHFKENVNKIILENKFEKIKDFFNLDVVSNSNIEIKSESQNNIIEIPLESLKLSVRAYNALKQAGFNDLREIIDFPLEKFMHIKNLGIKSAKEIIDMCKYYKVNGYDNFNQGNSNFFEAKFVTQEDFMSYAKYLDINELNLNEKANRVLSENKIRTLYDILTTNLYNLYSLGNTTKKHIDDICNYEKNAFMNTNYLSKECISNMPFNCIEGYSITRFNNYGNKMLTEIHDLFCSMSKEILRIKNFEDFMLVRIFIKVKSGSIKNINANLRDFFNINHINDREKTIVIKRAEGYTLEKLGKIYGVQRERIRQIEAKALNKLKKIFKASNFINYLHNKKKVDPTINETIIDDDYYKIFICRLDEIAEYKKVEIDGKIFFYDFILYKSAENLFKNLLASIKLNGYVSYDMIENLSVDQNLLDYFILKNNLEVVNGLLTTKSNKREKMALYLKQNLIIDISNNNVRNIMKDLEINYDLMFDSERAFIGILNAVSYSIGSGKYTSLDNDPIIPKEIMELIINDIKTKKFIKTEVLYENYKGKIINLLSPTHLYLYIKKKYPNEYNYGGTNLVISTKGTKTSQSSRVYEYLQNIAEPVKRDDLRMMFGLDSVAMNVIEQQNDDIIKYGKNKYFLRGKLFASKENIDLISKYICGMKSFLVDDLYKYCLIKKLSIINDNFITSVEEFTSFCCNFKSNIFDDFILNKDNYRFERIEDENNLNDDDLEFELDL